MRDLAARLPHSQLFEPRQPLLHPFASGCRHAHVLWARHDVRECVGDRLDVNLRQVRQQIDLGNQHEIGLQEHHRVFQRLVFALGDRQRDDVGLLAEVVDGRAHQVADVFDEQVIELVPRKS